MIVGVCPENAMMWGCLLDVLSQAVVGLLAGEIKRLASWRGDLMVSKQSYKLVL